MTHTQAEIGSIPQGVVDAAIGFGNAFGASYIRDWLGVDGDINYDSGAYGISNVVGTGASLVGGVGLGARAVGYSVWLRRYPNAGGGGMGLDRFGRNIIRAGGTNGGKQAILRYRPHIDIPKQVKHWPWK